MFAITILYYGSVIVFSIPHDKIPYIIYLKSSVNYIFLDSEVMHVVENL
jgi:hypothetical protein